ncbi:MAG: type VI secretion system protein TssA [Chthoniobacter sp.]
MDIEPLLQPVSPESPCGEDISYDPVFIELETLAKGKEAQQFSGSDNPEWQVSAQEPDWQEVRGKCTELLARSKDLRVTIYLILAGLKMEGVPGLRDGLTFLQRLIHDQWAGVYPRLDPEDNNDPTERINIIAGLSKPLATFGDPIRFIERVRLVPLSNSSQMGRFSLAAITQVGLPPNPEATPPSAAQIEAAFRDTKAADLEALNTAASGCRTALGEIDSDLMEKVGSAAAPNFDELTKVLGEIQATLAPFVSQPAAGATTGADSRPDNLSAPEPSGASAGASATRFSGEIRSRNDVVRAIDQICEYYRKAEPGNPVPLLLRRAQRLVDKDFMTLIEDLIPDSVSQLANITGKKREASAAPEAESDPSSSE